MKTNLTDKQKLVGEIMHHVNNKLGGTQCHLSLLKLQIKSDELSKEEILSELQKAKEELTAIGEYLSEVFNQNS